MYWSVKHAPMNIWCEFGKDRLKIKGCRAHSRKKAFGPVVAKNGTAEC